MRERLRKRLIFNFSANAAGDLSNSIKSKFGILHPVMMVKISQISAIWPDQKKIHYSDSLETQ